MMTDQHERLERSLEEALERTAPPSLPTGLLARVEEQVDRHRHRPLLLAALREPAMRLDARVVVGSPAVRMAALIAATILLVAGIAGAGIAGSRLLAGHRTLVVDPSGDGSATTIAEAIRLAGGGDTILVRPGMYVEAVLVDKDVTIRGDGPAEAIVLSAPPDGPTTKLAANRGDPYAVLVRDAAPTIAGITLVGQSSAIHVEDGRPRLEELILEGVGRPHTHSMGLRTFPDAILIAQGSSATIGRNTLVGGGAISVYDPATARIAGNTLVEGPSILSFTDAPGTVISDNTIRSSLNRGIGLFSRSAPAVTVERNTIIDPATAGISVGRGTGVGIEPLLNENTIDGAAAGIVVAAGAAPYIEGNTVISSGTGLIVVGRAPDLSVIGNGFFDNDIGVSLERTEGRFEGNRFCGNDTDVVVATEATGPPIRGETCAQGG